MKKNSFLVIFVLAILFIIVFTVQAFNPLRKTPTQIRTQLLTIIPIGTPIDEAMESIKTHPKWTLEWISKEHGYCIDSSGIPSENGSESVGTMSIRVHLGYYKNFFRTDVTAYLGFDRNAKLIDVAIRKDTDSF